MKLLKTSLLTVLLLCIVSSCSKEDSGNASEEVNYSIDLNLAQETDWELADQVLVLINEHRTSIGLETISKDQQHASAYAVDHTKYMIDNNEISHDNFSFRNNGMKNRGAESVGEIVAYGYNNAESVVSAWLNSPSHKSVIEGPYAYSGFGIIENSQGQYFFTQLFYRK
ncbi:MAG: hypothetical protein ACI9SJ_002400 [Flavobacteriaceae bacterium]|jgi:uncharacterized protein YkwD|uniref:CAP domain-containing protein n=1 Tax=Candidatus Marifrigoribacter sp. Uisw_064 TaxID=3230970 RepID=UPI003ADB6C8F